MFFSDSQSLITGVYRSGTEFVAQLVSGHPGLSSTMYHVNALRFLWNRYDPLDQADNLERAIADTATRLADRYEMVLNTDGLAQGLRESGRVDYGALYDALMTRLWLSPSRRHWVEKVQMVWRQIPDFLASVPNGRAVLVIRDPRSVLISFKKNTYHPEPAYLGAIFNCLDAMIRGQEMRRALPAERFLLTTYEELARHPHDGAARLYRFLGQDPDHASFDPHSWTDLGGNPWKANSSFDDGSAGFDIDKAINRWRSGLSREEIALTEAICGPIMAEYGYELSHAEADWPAMLRLFMADDNITDYFRQWLLTGQGIQAYPSDPLVRSNWTEIRETGR